MGVGLFVPRFVLMGVFRIAIGIPVGPSSNIGMVALEWVAFVLVATVALFFLHTVYVAIYHRLGNDQA